ncbi:MAG: hypothetical protein HKL84_09005 [Acidimicrobiaceae bacterium]|nr:hypothetical protein [Acidimicrobiaceae bacterium]
MSVSNWEITKRFLTPENPKIGSSNSKTHPNTKLTAMTGLLIFFLLAAEGATIPFIGKLFTLHAFIGWVLLPPILLKIASTSYRFAMYYLGNPKYTKAGPPKPLLRLLGPLVVITTALLMWSGIELVLLGPLNPSTALWRNIHRASFVLWFGFMAIHVLAYFLKAGSLALPELSRRPRAHSIRTPGKNLRLALVAGSLVIGVILGMVEWHLTGPWIALYHNHLKIR